MGPPQSRRARPRRDLLRCDVALLKEKFRIKDERKARIAPRGRPHYPPTERLAILGLRAARNWSARQTARRVLLTSAAIASWMRRLDEQGNDALLRVPVPVNRIPNDVTHVVQRLKSLCPSMGRKRIANVLARAGLHLSCAMVRRWVRRPIESEPGP